MKKTSKVKVTYLASGTRLWTTRGGGSSVSSGAVDDEAGIPVAGSWHCFLRSLGPASVAGLGGIVWEPEASSSRALFFHSGRSASLSSSSSALKGGSFSLVSPPSSSSLPSLGWFSLWLTSGARRNSRSYMECPRAEVLVIPRCGRILPSLSGVQVSIDVNQRRKIKD